MKPPNQHFLLSAEMNGDTKEDTAKSIKNALHILQYAKRYVSGSYASLNAGSQSGNHYSQPILPHHRQGKLRLVFFGDAISWATPTSWSSLLHCMKYSVGPCTENTISRGIFIKCIDFQIHTYTGNVGSYVLMV